MIRAKVDRWDAGTLRRYHIGRAVLVVSRNDGRRSVRVIPACCAHIMVEIEPAEAARQLVQLRREARP